MQRDRIARGSARRTRRLRGDHRPRHGDAGRILGVGGHLLAPGGRLLAIKGARPDAEIAALPTGWQLEGVHPLAVPGLAAERHLVVVGRAVPRGA